MMTSKEIKIATFDCVKAFKERRVADLGGEFFPYKPDMQKKMKTTLLLTLIFAGLFVFLYINAFFNDAVHYWHFDLTVLVGILVVIVFLGATIASIGVYFWQRRVKKQLEESNDYFGVVITDSYYFEYLPDVYQYIPKENIVNFSYSETLKDGKAYTEFLMDVDGELRLQGLVYDPEVFDPKTWVGLPEQERSELSTD